MTNSPKKLVNSIALFALCCINVGCNKQAQDTVKSAQNVTFSVSNPSKMTRADVSVQLDEALLINHDSKVNTAAFSLWHDQQEIPSQTLDKNEDGITDHLIFNTSFAPFQKKTFTLRYQPESTSSHNYPVRTHAELAVNKGGELIGGKYQNGTFTPVDFQLLPTNHTIGDQLFKYEGPGWESDKVAYRLYFDERNVIDIFGKKTSEIVLPQVGQPGGNYHKDAPWGLDVLKVGDSLGIGSIGMYVDGKVHRVDNTNETSVSIVGDGSLQSHVRLNYQGWQVAEQTHNLISNLSINAGSRLTQNSIVITGQPENLVTGIVKHQPATLLHSSENSGEWAYMATFGKQSYVNDELGMAIFYKKSSLITLTEDAHSYLIVMKPQDSTLDYYFAATWAQDTDAITTKDAFITYLDHELKKLNEPLAITQINNKQ